jgi:hypothetical protein
MGRSGNRAVRAVAASWAAMGAATLLVALASGAGAAEHYPADTTPTTAAPRAASTSTTTTTTTASPPPTTPPTTIQVKGAHAEAEPTGTDEPIVSRWVDALPTVHDLSLDEAAPNLGFALLFMFLTALPAIIFNSTFQEHHAVIARGMAPFQTRLSGLQGALGSVPSGLLLGGFSLLGALVYAQLEPGFGLDQASLVLWLALATSIFLMTGVLEYVRGWRLHRRTGVRCRLQTLPLSLLVAGLLVLISRLSDLHPGYVFGVVAGLAVTRHITDEDDGASLAAGYALLLGLAAGAWAAWIPVRDGLGSDPSFGAAFLDALLSSFWVISLQTVLFSLIPISFLYGHKVFRWNRGVWLALELVAAFGFFMLLQNPAASGVSEHNLSTAFLSFLAFLGFSLVFWAWFRFVHPRRTVARDVEGREVLS